MFLLSSTLKFLVSKTLLLATAILLLIGCGTVKTIESQEAETPPPELASPGVAPGQKAHTGTVPPPMPSPTPSPTPPSASEKFPEMSWERRFILGNISISKWFDGVAEGLDRYLVEKQLTTKTNETSVEVENSTDWAQGKDVSNSTSLNVNLRLPNVEEYWHLKFTSYDEIEEKRSVRRGVLRQNPREKNYGATIGLFKRLGNVRTAFQPRIELQGTPAISHSLTFESVADTKTFQINPKLEFYATPNKGAGTSQALNLHFPLSKIYSLTFINQADYQDRLHLYLTNIGLSVGQAITEKTGIGYGLIFDGSNQPNYHLTNYSVSITWSELLYLKILDYQITGYYSFPEGNNYTGVPGVILTINLLF